MMFVNCPLCGQKLMQGKGGSCVQVKCNKCGKILIVEIDNISVTVTFQNTKENSNGVS